MSIKLSPQEWQLISSYLDHQVSAEEKTAVETRLEQDARFRQAFDGLQRTRALLRSAPARKAPRSFTLTREMVAPKPLARWLPVFNWGSITASAVAVILFFTTNLLPNLGMAYRIAPMAAEAPAAAVEMASPDTAPAEDSNYNRSPIIQWGAPPVYGIGGGGGGDGSSETIVGGKGGGPESVPVGPLSNGAPEGTTVDLPPTPQDQPLTPEMMPTQIEPLPGNPILGLPAPETAGKEINPAGYPAYSDEADRQPFPAANLIAAVLAFLAVLLAIAALLVRKQLRS